MSRLSRFLNQWRRPALDREFEEEVAFHLATRIEANLRRGLSRGEAEAEARRQFGSTLRAQEGMREARVSGWLDAVVRDCRHGARLFRRHRGATALAVLILSLGIGANAAIFSLLNAALVRPLPFPDPDRLVSVSDGLRSNPSARAGPTIPELLDVRSWSRNFAAISFFDTRDAQINGGAEPARVFAARVEPALLPLLGVRPALGRLFAEGDGASGSGFVAILTDGLWRRNFGAEPAVIGRTLVVNGLPHRIVGVLPADFTLDYLTAEPLELFLPYPMIPLYTSRSGEFANVRRVAAVGRIKQGVSVAEASAELDALSRVLAREHPALYRSATAAGQDPDFTMSAMPLRDEISAGNRRAVLLLVGAVVLVLLIACANTAQFLFARSIEREAEVAVRSALGAGRGRLVRQFLAETLVLAGTAGALGLVHAVWLSTALRALLPQARVVGPIGVDVPVLIFTMLAALATALACGLMPALRVSPANPVHGLETRGAGAARTRIRHVLIAVEVAISLVLLVGAGLLVRALLDLQRAQGGFSDQDVTVMQMRGVAGPQTPVGEVYRQYLDRLAAVPGVAAAAIAAAPLPGRPGFPFELPTRTEDAAARSRRSASYLIVSPDYFSVLRIPLVEGRTFSGDDRIGRPPVAIVNSELARAVWPGESAIGRLIRAGEGPRAATMTVVGVVGNVRPIFQPDDVPQMYVPSQQQNEPSVSLLIRSDEGVPLSLDAVKQAIWSVEPRQAVFRVQSMRGSSAGAARSQRVIAILLGSFASLALVMSVIGVYNVVSYVTSRRLREIALRLVLGATASDVLSLLAGQTLRWVVAGLIAGGAAAFAGTGLLRVAVAGVGPLDAATIGTISLLYLLLVVSAMSVPVLRSLRLDPAAALRAE
jgi:putative ABC transport system permease protein